MEITTTYVEITCATEECGIIFFIPNGYNDRRRNDHKNFHCPNGHINHYPGKTSEAILRERIESKDSEIQRLNKELRLAKKPTSKKKR